MVRVESKAGTHPLMVKQIQNLPSSTPSVNVKETSELQAFVDILREVSMTFGTRDITKEFVACNCCPISDC
jgi:hypothetical protein